jgi:HK97 family phage major capsid protein
MTREEFSRLLDAALATRRAQTPDEPDDLGSLFTRSSGYLENVGKTGQIKADFEIPFVFSRTTGDPATTTGLTSIQKLPGVVTLGQQPLRIADLMVQTPTNNTTIRYISENSLTNAATAVAENGALPEATWDLVETDAVVRKYSVIGRVTTEMFEDYEAVRAYINNRLAYMVAIKEDNALLNADASSNQIKGILQFTGIQTQAQNTDTALDALYKAINKVRTVGFFEPDAIVLNPVDLQNFRLMKDKNGQYYFGGPFTGSYGQPGQAGFVLMIWGLPVVWTNSIAAGTALVGAFRMGAQIFRKAVLGIEITNSDASDFANNRIAIRANSRLTLANFRPAAFCQVTGLN